MTKEFNLENLFVTQKIKNKLSKENLSNEFTYPVYSSDTTNNGIIGFTDKPEFICNKENPVYITFGDHTRTFNIARKSFSVLDNVKVLLPKINNDEVLLYLITVWQKQIPNLGYSRHWKIAKDCKLNLPVLLDENKKPIIDDTHFYHEDGYIPDFKYMQERIEELEQERIEELEQYLIATGLNDYELTAEDIELLYCENVNKCYKDFKLKNIVEVLTPIKRFNANTVVITENVGYPYVVRTSSNNGIRGYINEDIKYLNEGNTFSFGQDTSTIFWQPKAYFTSDKIKVLKPKFKCNEELALYIKNRIEKAFSGFSWGSQSFKISVIENINVSLPIQTDSDNTPIIDSECKYHPKGYIPDWNFMEKYIKAIEKTVITDVVKYKDSVLEHLNSVIDCNSTK